MSGDALIANLGSTGEVRWLYESQVSEEAGVLKVKQVKKSYPGIHQSQVSGDAVLIKVK